MRKRLLLQIFAASLLLSSCDVFPTRTPETPSSNSSTFEPATNYETVLQNLISSVNASSISNYEKCFSSVSGGDLKEFEFIPSTSAASLNPGVFSYWTSVTEVQVMKSVFTSLQAETNPTLSLSDIKYNSVSADSVNLSADYSLTMTFSGDANSTTYSGNMFFDIYKDNSGYWYINRETDFENEAGYLSWSYLKIKYSN